MTRVAIINDPDPYSIIPDDRERAMVLDDLTDHGFEPKVVYSGTEFDRIPNLDVDLLVVDFGGAAQSYSSPVGDWMRIVMAWADNHPSSFVFLWSTMTADFIGAELRDRLPGGSFDDTRGWWKPVPWPDNMRALDAGWLTAGYGDNRRGWREESWARARAWFGITGPAASTRASFDGVRVD